MRYIGSKTATLPWLAAFVAEKAPEARSLCDPFAGTCTVARHFKALGFRIITGDVLSLSFVIQTATIALNAVPTFRMLQRADRIRKRNEIRRHMARARNRKGFGWKRWNTQWLYESLRLYNGYKVRWLMPKVAPAR